MDYSKLRGRIREVCKTEAVFAQAIGISRTTVSLRLNGKTQWTMPEMKKACAILNIPMVDIESYFFTAIV
ncbi:MAG: DUF739 family protein [Sphaerochaetaceae bacterium]